MRRIGPATRRLPAPGLWPSSDELAAWRLAPTAFDGSGDFGAIWTPGETAVMTRLADVLDDAPEHYR